jgi:hypothetical protein
MDFEVSESRIPKRIWSENSADRATLKMNVEIFGHCFPADEERIAKRRETSRWIFITAFFT